MLEAAAVLFTIQIPTTAEEQRLKLKKRQQREREATTKTKQAEPCTLRISPANESTVVKRPATQLAYVVEHVELNGTPLDTAMEEVLRQILHKFNINNAMWLRNLEGNAYQITFSLEFDELYENLSEALQQFGIGDREGSTFSVTNCIASTSFATNCKEAGKKPIDKCSGAINNNAHKHSGWNRFMNSVRSRLNVTQIVRDVRQDAAITFDFCILLVSAAILASFGLVENSTIFLASSMLISPLMGPNIAAIFGTVIQERSLRRLGMRNELIGILMATLVGFLFGLVVCTTDKKYGIGEGLTEEMLSRCDVHSLVVGLFTAIPSGAAAAIGILGGNIGSLVGVAISASLLPPAVNSGLLWALACIYKLFEHDDSLYVDVVKSRKYSDNQATELAVLGGISMCLTLSNVLFIYMMGILVLKVKQIAPVIGRSNRQFWKHDIKLSRGDAAIIDQLLANLAKEQPQDMHDDFLRQLDEHAYQHTWSPRSIRHSFSTQQPYCNVSTIHRLEQLY
ncbi:CG7384, partial [Drosophila busckii]